MQRWLSVRPRVVGQNHWRPTILCRAYHRKKYWFSFQLSGQDIPQPGWWFINHSKSNPLKSCLIQSVIQFKAGTQSHRCRFLHLLSVFLTIRSHCPPPAEKDHRKFISHWQPSNNPHLCDVQQVHYGKTSPPCCIFYQLHVPKLKDLFESIQKLSQKHDKQEIFMYRNIFFPRNAVTWFGRMIRWAPPTKLIKFTRNFSPQIRK